MQTAMLVPEAAKLGKKRWAIVYPELRVRAIGHRGVQEADERRGKAAGSSSSRWRCRWARSIRARSCRRCSTRSPTRSSRRCSAPDLARFVREGQLRGLFKDRPVFNLLGGEPEYLDPLKDEAPVGWYVTGYPWYAIDTPEHKRFRDAYQAKFNDYPRLGSVVGYSTVIAAAAATQQGRVDRSREARRGDEGPRRSTRRSAPVTFRADRPPVDDGRVRRPHGGQGRQGRDGRLALRRRQGLPARATTTCGGCGRPTSAIADR